VNFLRDNKDAQNKTETLLGASKEVGLEVNAEKTMLLSQHQNADLYHDIKRANRSYENVAQFEYLEITIIN
jgi:predicted DsbA family dithiol-disulfide isomerase